MRIFWAAFYLGLWEVLLLAQNPGLMTDDSGEIAAAASCLGVGHAPGFPLYNLLAHLAGLVPVGAPAFRLNLLAAFFMLLAVHFTLSACRKLSDGLLPAAKRGSRGFPTREVWLVFIALSMVFCESVFAQSLTAKGGIYALTLLGVSAMLWACVQETPGFKSAWVLFLWAAGMGNHWPFQVFWLILLGHCFGPAMWRWGRPRKLAALSFVLIGLSVFLYLPLRAALSPALNWENPSTFGAFWSVVMRKSAPAAEFASRGMAQYGRNLLEYLFVMGRHWWPGFFLLSAAGGWWLFSRRRSLALGLLVGYAFLVAAFVRVAHFDAATLYLVANYLVTTQAVPAVLGFAGVLALFGRWTAARPRPGLALALAGVLGAAAWGAAVFERQQKSRYTLSEDLGANLLKELPRDAVILLDSDVVSMPALYQRYALGLRPDLTLVFLPFLGSEWGFNQTFLEYRDRISSPGPVNGFSDAVRLFMDPQRVRGSGVFYACYKQTLEGADMRDLVSRLFPWGVSYRLQEGEVDLLEVSSNVRSVASGRRLRNLECAKNLPETEFTRDVYLNHYARGDGEAEKLLLENNQLYPAVLHARKALEVFPAMGGIYYNLSAYFKRSGYPKISEVFLDREIEAAPGMEEGKKAALKYLAREPSPRVAAEKTAGDYLVLAEKYGKDGQPWLAEAATEASQRK